MIQIPLVALSNGPTLVLLLRIDPCFPLITPTQTMPLLQPKMTHRAANAEHIIVGLSAGSAADHRYLMPSPPQKSFEERPGT